MFTGVWRPPAARGLLRGAPSSPPAASANYSRHVLQAVPAPGGLCSQGTQAGSLGLAAVTAKPQQSRFRRPRGSGRMACPPLLLLLVFLFLLLLLLWDAKELLAAELLEGQLQDLLQDLLITVSLTKGVRLGLGWGSSGGWQGRGVRGGRGGRCDLCPQMRAGVRTALQPSPRFL